MKIRFRRKRPMEWVVLFVWALPFAFSLLTDTLAMPSAIKYAADIGWVMLLMGMLALRGRFANRQVKHLAIAVSAFFLTTLVGAAAHFHAAWYYLWGIRNVGRFFVFFFACTCFLEEKRVGAYLRFLDMLFWINLPVVLIQYGILGETRDTLGGIFGTEKGCNGYLNIFLVIVSAKTMLCCLQRQEPAWKCLAKLAAALLVAVLAELKMFFLELLVILVMAVCMTGISVGKVGLLAGVVAAVLVCAKWVGDLFPEFAGWFTVENILRIAADPSGYTGNRDMNRLTAFFMIPQRFLQTPFDRLFGLGLGNCDYASFAFLTTPFYRNFGHLNYTWFSAMFLLLETGFLGLALYCGFYAVVYVAAGRRMRSGRGNLLYCRLAKILAVLSLLILVYNSSLRTEAGYMMFFMLALPFIKEEKSLEDRTLAPGVA